MDLNASFSDVKAKADELFANLDYLGAAEEYRRLLTGYPNNSLVMKQLGLSLTMGQLVNEGVPILKDAAALQPADPEIRYAYGYALGVANQFDDAINELDAALNLQPNHVAARQGLIFCLLTSGQAISQVDPLLGEQRLSRAYKLDSRNPHVIAAYMDALAKAEQVGKVVNLAKEVDPRLKGQSPLAETLARFVEDPKYAVHFKHSAYDVRSNQPTRPDGAMIGSIRQVRCPACKQMIVDYAAICPQCGLRIRATGNFAAKSEGSGIEWQEIAFTVTALAWLAVSLLGLWAAYPAAQKAQFGNMSSAQMVASGFQAVLALGLLFRQDWLAYIAKVFCIVSIGAAALFATLYLSDGKLLMAGLYGAQIAVTSFMAYLIGYVMGD
jgi:tetratricopeptide (TPR) repeat protein